MRGSKLAKLALAAVATAALLVGNAAAPALAAYPPAVSGISASDALSGGFVTVTVVGTDLSSAISVKAAYGNKSVAAALSVNAAKTVGSAQLKVASILPTTAGRYPVNISTIGYTQSITKSYTIGTPITLKSVKVSKNKKGLKVSGKAIKNAKVKISVAYKGKTKSKSVKCNKSGSFSYSYSGSKKGTYAVTVAFVADKKYFGAAPVVVTVLR